MNSRNPTGRLSEILALNRPIVIGHRGFCSIAPENTMASFKLALEAKADAIELDYHHSQDEVPVVIHDDVLDRTTNARKLWRRRRIPVQSTTAADIRGLDAGSWFEKRFTGERVPLLSEALKFLYEAGGLAVIERKSGDAVTCARLLRELNLINDVVVMSFDWNYLNEFHDLLPEQSIGALGPPACLSNGSASRRESNVLNARWLDEAGKIGARVVAWNQKVSEAAISQAHERGLKLWIYTVDSCGEASRLVERGVDGIITNNPPSMLKCLRRNPGGRF